MAEPQLLTNGATYATLPQRYIRPEHQRPRLDQVVSDDNIPVIDLSNPDRAQLIQQIAQACISYGFFQVINHGVQKDVVENMKAVMKEFFRLPAEEKLKLYSEDPTKKTRVSTSFQVRKGAVHNWRDYLRLHCYPLEEATQDWPSKPPQFKEIVSNYCRELRGLGIRLLKPISLSLGLEEDYLEKVMGELDQHMAINLYPRCPEPELTFGVSAHADPTAITILLQDEHVSGLQVLKDGKWLAVDPYPDAFLVNPGDQLQALSNGKYKSIWHRVVVNTEKERMSIATFLFPCDTAVIEPAKKLTEDGSPAVYRSYTYEEYYSKFLTMTLDQEHCLDLFRA